VLTDIDKQIEQETLAALGTLPETIRLRQLT